MSALKEKKFYENSYNHFENFVKSYRDFNDDLFEDMTMRTYLLDMLYGIGVSISDEYKMADGFDKFKADLFEFLKEE